MKRNVKGFSLVEVMVATVALAIDGLGVMGVSRSAAMAIDDNAVRYDAHVQAARAVDTLARHLRGATLSSMTTLPPGFVTPQDVDQGVPADNLAFRALVFVPEEADANLFEMDDAALAKLGITQLPQSLSDALTVMERSQLVQEALGEHIFEWFLRNKRREWRDYKTHVSQFEIDRYLRAI